MLPQYTPLRNLRDLPGSITLSAILSGLVVVVIGYTSPLIIVLQAAEAGNLPPNIVSSWVWAIALGAGLTSLIMSLGFRLPMLGAWPTAGAALMVTALPQYNFAEIIGAYMLVGIALILIGWSGLFSRVMALVPRPVVMGMLGGVLFRFGIGVFSPLPKEPLLILVMVGSYFGFQRLGLRTPTIGALIVGVVVAALQGSIHLQDFTPMLATPTLTMPAFSVKTILGVSIPMFMVVLASQFAPGMAVLQSVGYQPPIDRALIICGIGSILLAPFGSHGLCMGAITAAIVALPEAHPDPAKRYTAGVANGVFYIIAALFGATAVALFAGLPPALIAAISGLALTPTLITAFSGSMSDDTGREGGMVALLCAAANFTWFGIGAAFWALLLGVGVHTLLTRSAKGTTNHKSIVKS